MLILATIVGVGVLVGFMSLVGSPSEVETIIGLIIGALAFLVTLITGWRVRSNFHEDNQSQKIAALERNRSAEGQEITRRKAHLVQGEVTRSTSWVLSYVTGIRRSGSHG